ncbi:Hypothetical protein A7982_02181 [Minicystis rosea]|nr:Hypothetical protein A7982_02181 [Minicystis rosea]
MGDARAHGGLLGGRRITKVRLRGELAFSTSTMRRARAPSDRPFGPTAHWRGVRSSTRVDVHHGPLPSFVPWLVCLDSIIVARRACPSHAKECSR